MITLRSAFPVRISYNISVRSDPTEASTEDSEGLKRMEVTLSVEVEYVRLDRGFDLENKFKLCESLRNMNEIIL